MLAAGDTFRAAAVEQLQIWGERTGCPVVTRPSGADAAGLAYDALAPGAGRGRDILLIDTAGRLHNKADLMAELQKIVRVLKKVDPQAPHSVLLVLDATTGQNAHAQAEIFREMVGVTGIVMTKLDGTARGGVLVSLAEKYGIPIHALGVGESSRRSAPVRGARLRPQPGRARTCDCQAAAQDPGGLTRAVKSRVSPRLAIMLQRPADRWESQLGPRDLLPVEEADLKALGPGGDRLVEQPGAIDQLHLADARDVVDRQQPFDLDPRPRLLPGLALGASARRFIRVQESPRARSNSRSAARSNGGHSRMRSPHRATEPTTIFGLS